uniref:Mitogen-activated protein kinase kinase kinase 15 n=1 Tax=Lygus hesperus TaxID=30085 RepID=A0A0A9Y6K5_LYGHE
MFQLSFTILFSVFVASSALTGCELMDQLVIYNENNLSAKIDTNDFSLALCIAGYHNNLDVEYTVAEADSLIEYVGIFGIPKNEIDKCSEETFTVTPILNDTNLQDDIQCLANVVFKSPTLRRLYAKLCQPQFISVKERCPNDLHDLSPTDTTLLYRIYTRSMKYNDLLKVLEEPYPAPTKPTTTTTERTVTSPPTVQIQSASINWNIAVITIQSLSFVIIFVVLMYVSAKIRERVLLVKQEDELKTRNEETSI